MNMLTTSIQSALETLKSIPTVFRVSDAQFAKGGGRIGRILGTNVSMGDNGENQRQSSKDSGAVSVSHELSPPFLVHLRDIKGVLLSATKST